MGPVGQADPVSHLLRLAPEVHLRRRVGARRGRSLAFLPATLDCSARFSLCATGGAVCTPCGFNSVFGCSSRQPFLVPTYSDTRVRMVPILASSILIFHDFSTGIGMGDWCCTFGRMHFFCGQVSGNASYV